MKRAKDRDDRARTAAVPMRRLLAFALLVVTTGALAGSAPSITQPSPPAGLTAIALDGRVELAWQPVPGSTYAVYRGANANSISARLTPTDGIPGTSFADTTAANGTSYFYAVRAVSDGVESVNSPVVSARPQGRACSTGNAVVLDNCFPGTQGWTLTSPANVDSGGIEGFAGASSINKGESVDLKIKASDGSTFRVEIYRTGYYGGAGGRLFSTIHGLAGCLQAPCLKDSSTGLADCSNWAVSATLTTTSSWPSGVYLLKLVREDTGSDNHILLTVRDDARSSDLLYGVSDTDYQAYNNYGGKSLYNFNSSGSITVSGTPRAVKVSYDRPYEQPRSGHRDWYTRIDYPTVYWLEREGYDVAYQSNVDMERNGARVHNHRAYISPAHDEYYSAAMRSALEQARDAGVDLFFTGANEIYWKIRFENSPQSGGPTASRSSTRRRPRALRSTRAGSPRAPGAIRPARTSPRTRSRASCTSATTTPASSRSGERGRRGRPRLSLHGPRHAAPRDLHVHRLVDRRLGVGRPRRERPRARRREDTRELARHG